MNSKGMSQVLAIIIGASVFMMVALLLITSAGDVLTGAQDNTQQQGCIQLGESKCTASPGQGEVDLPDRCSQDTYECGGSGPTGSFFALPSFQVPDPLGSESNSSAAR